MVGVGSSLPDQSSAVTASEIKGKETYKRERKYPRIQLLTILASDIYRMEQEKPNPLSDRIVGQQDLKRKVRLVALHRLHEEYELQKADERQAKRRYADLLKPLYARASELILGANPKPSQTTLLPTFLKPGEQPNPTAGLLIERYWFTAISFSELQETAHEGDERLLEYLLDVQRPYPLETDTLTLTFIFAPNTNVFAPEETRFTRRLRYGRQGKAVSLGGDIPTWKVGRWPQWRKKKETDPTTLKVKLTKGVKIESFFDIFLDWDVRENPRILAKCEWIMRTLSEMVGNSYRAFLGLRLLENQEGEEDDGVGYKQFPSREEMEEVRTDVKKPAK